MRLGMLCLHKESNGRNYMQHIRELDAKTAQNIRYVLMDIDDTITTAGKLPAIAYSALWQLHDAGLKVIPITGRPAGWCDLIARQWPVDGVVGENGALAFWEEDGLLKELLHPQGITNRHPTLEIIKKRVFEEIPNSRLAKDQFSRLFDIAFDFAEEEPRLSLGLANQIKTICEEEGAIAKISSIHVNAWLGEYSKLEMTQLFLTHRWGYNDELEREQVLFFGDSPNDEPMFAHFTSVGVANINNYGDYIEVWPKYLTSLEGGEGFAEGVERLLTLR